MSLKQLVLVTLFALKYMFSFAGNDSLILKKSFPAIPTKIIMDTLIQLEASPLDTFGYVPAGIIIIRDWDGRIINDFVNVYIVPDKNKNERMGLDYNAITGTFLFSEYWKKPWNEGKGIISFTTHFCRKQTDTIRFKTKINFDSTTKLTYYYEVQLGRDAFKYECKVMSSVKLKEKDKKVIQEIFDEMGYWDLIETERRSIFNQRLYSSKELSRKVRKKVWCWCERY